MTGRATITVHPEYRIGDLDRRMFGAFVEHMGRSVYDGIFEPGHDRSDENGFRRDVLDLVRELGVTMVRYPGGNFVSGYRWTDGIGPIESRPRRLDLAWHSLETNRIGLDEFMGWAESAGVDVMYAVNLGTADTQQALDVLEYANAEADTDTEWTRLRKANGAPQPYGIKMWCLGNEMDAPWQIGHTSAAEYARRASTTAKAMHRFDPDLELVVCGSSGTHMPTFGAWEHEVLRQTYADVSHISCHAYYQERNGDLDSFLASPVDMDRMIESVAAIADAVRTELGETKRMQISFDEWNVWYTERYHSSDKIRDTWPVAPRILEDIYTVADAVVVGGMLISLLNHADRVTSASLAQLVNVIAPIMTEPGGPAWKQTTFFPFATTARLAHRSVLRTVIDSPDVETALYGVVPAIDAAVSHDPSTGAASLMLTNRHRHESVEVIVDVTAFDALEVAESVTLADPDPYAANTIHEQERVGLRDNATATMSDGRLAVVLPPVSWTAVSLTPAAGAGADS